MMIARIRRGLTFANVMSVIAVFLALGGTVYATNKISGKTIKKGSEPGNRLKNNSVTGKQVKESTLGTVPNANALQGQGPGAFAPANIEAVHVVGQPGEPPFTNGWTIPTAATDQPVEFYKDPYGIVHLQGSASISVATSNPVFTLPAGYTPAKNLYYAVYTGGGATTIQITAAGQVNPFAGTLTFIGLSNVTFRAGV